jgi:hypothetical protein
MLSNYKISILLFCLGLISCKKEETFERKKTFYKEEITPEDRKSITSEEAKSYRISTDRQYEYRTGKAGHYEYNYDVKGISVKGDSVFGNINIEGKYGAGILTNDTTPDTEIKAEWVDYGKLKAIDSQGNEYQLVVK